MVRVSDSLRKNPSFKHMKEVPVKKQVWVKKERKVEEVKMLSEVTGGVGVTIATSPWLDLACSYFNFMSKDLKLYSDLSQY